MLICVNPSMNIAAHMIRAGRGYRECPAVAKGTTVLRNYGELADRVAALATTLTRRFGLAAGDRVALMLFNCPEYIELLYAVWHAGLVVVPINAKLHRNEFEYILKNSGSKLCFTSPELTDVATSLADDVLANVIEVGGSDYDRLVETDPAPLATRQPDDPAWLFYTSGTTGLPKGATLSHRNLMAMCHCYFTDVDPISPWSAILHAAPMSHGSGLYGLAFVIQAGCHVIPEQSGFNCAEVYELIEHWPGVAFFAAPTMVRRLLDQDPGSDTTNLKAIVYGGGPMYVEDCREALRRFGPKLTQLYGQGESPMTITALSARMHADNDHPRWLERLASVGIAQSGVELRIADTDDRPLPVGEVGEVLVRGDSVMLGYWDDPAATAEALKGGWLHTGDCGVLDDDGFLTLKDRAKELTGGAGCDVVYDTVGGDYAEAAIRATAWGGRFLVIGFTAGIPSVPLNLTLLKSCSIVGVFFGAMMSKEPELGAEVVKDLLDYTATGKLNPHVSERYALEQAPEALRSMIDRRALGKIVIEPGVRG